MTPAQGCGPCQQGQNTSGVAPGRSDGDDQRMAAGQGGSRILIPGSCTGSVKRPACILGMVGRSMWKTHESASLAGCSHHVLAVQCRTHLGQTGHLPPLKRPARPVQIVCALNHAGQEIGVNIGPLGRHLASCLTRDTKTTRMLSSILVSFCLTDMRTCALANSEGNS